jgi:HD-GYP domain-containing protein (c-di-GMP phosphodiesterase class II)
LHDIGKIGLPDLALGVASNAEGTLKMEWNKHPAKGQSILSGLQDLHVPARFVRHHHERFDGQGLPDGLLGDEIPLGARILAVAEDYDELQLGWLDKRKFDEAGALLFIQGSSGRRYDPNVVAALPKALEHLKVHPREDEVILRAFDLSSGMKVSRDLVGADGVLLLAHDRMVTSVLVQRLQDLKRSGAGDTKVYVYRNTVPLKN